MPRASTEAASLADGPTLASTRDYWILHLRSEGKSERTISTYLRALDRLDAFLVERGMPRALGAIRREHLEAFFVALGELGNAPATISILFRALRPSWRSLVDEDEIEGSPMERMRTTSVALNPPLVLSDEQSAQLLAACRGTDPIARRDLAMLSLLLDTGIRRGELAALRLGDLNLGQRLAFIEASTSKSRRGRAVVYGDSTAKALMRYLRHQKAPRAEAAPLWIARTGQALTGNEIFHTIGRRARQVGLSVHPHQLRHTWASSIALGRSQRGRRHAARRLDRPLDAVALWGVSGGHTKRRAAAQPLPRVSQRLWNCDRLQPMKNITVSVPDDVYRKARIRAAELDSSVSGLVGAYLRSLARGDGELARFKSEWAQVRAEIADFRGGDRLSRDELHDRAVR